MKPLLGVFLAAVLFAGCGSTHTILPNNYVLSNPADFESTELKSRKAFVVLTPDFKAYQMKCGRHSIEMGTSVGDELWSMMKLMFDASYEVPSLDRAKARLWDKSDVIIVPDIKQIRVKRSLLGRIKVEIAMQFAFYSSTGELIATHTVQGQGSGSSSADGCERAAVEALMNVLRSAKTVFVQTLAAAPK